MKFENSSGSTPRDDGVTNGRGFRLKRHYSIVEHSSDVVEIRHGAWNPVSFTLTDETATGCLVRVLRRLDGRASIDDIATGEGVAKSDVEKIVDQLAELDLIEQRPTHALDYYLDHLVPNLLPYSRPDRDHQPSIVLFGDRALTDQIGAFLTASDMRDQYRVDVADETMRKVLLQCGGGTRFEPLAFEEAAEPFAEWRERFVVFATSSLNPVELRGFNRISLRHRISWVAAMIDGPFLFIGPTIIPFRTACYECAEMRILMNLREGASYQRYKRAIVEGRAIGSTAPVDSVLRGMLASLTAFEALNYMLTGASFTVSKLLGLYLPTMEFSFNEVLRLPGCAGCSPAPESDDRELYFDIRSMLNGDKL